jgi:hypothetical protein
MEKKRLVIIDHEEEGTHTVVDGMTLYDIFENYDELEEHEDYCLFHFPGVTYKVTQEVLNNYY